MSFKAVSVLSTLVTFSALSNTFASDLEHSFDRYTDVVSNSTDWSKTLSNIAPKGSTGLIIKVPEKNKDDFSAGEIRFTDYAVEKASELESTWNSADRSSAIISQTDLNEGSRSNSYYTCCSRTYYGGYYGYIPTIRIFSYSYVYYVPVYPVYFYISSGYYYYYIRYW